MNGVSGTPKLTRIVLVSADPERLAHFYADAFSFKDAGSAAPLDVGPAKLHGVRLRLNEQMIDIMASDTPGTPYPPNVSGRDTRFQHFAIVVSDMQKAYERLKGVPGWQAISTAGPQRLPAASGGVEAFKFRDPEGHPLEFLAFPEGQAPPKWRFKSSDEIFSNQICLGIDHSAISVSDTARSIAFYATLGLAVGSQSLNQGIEQARLDSVPEATVEVTSLLLPDSSAPHVELLCYRDHASHGIKLDPTAVAATELVFSLEDAGIYSALCDTHKNAILTGPEPEGHVTQVLLHDPDGHLIRFECLWSA